jgi:hypothetical protein
MGSGRSDGIEARARCDARDRVELWRGLKVRLREDWTRSKWSKQSYSSSLGRGSAHREGSRCGEARARGEAKGVES